MRRARKSSTLWASNSSASLEPALYLEGDILLQKVKADLNKVYFGAYSIGPT